MEIQINIYTKHNKKEWQRKLDEMSMHDFYHTYSYNLYYSKNNSSPILFCYKEDEEEIIIPFILRKIENTCLFDITSSYGYGGPISSHKYLKEGIIENFTKAINQYFLENNIVSVFCRLHPIFKNENLLNGLGTILPLSKTVYIDLRKDLNTQINQFRKGVKYNIKKLRKEGYSVYEDINKEFLEEFITFYNDNMIRVNARDDYYFDKKYYNTICKSPDINSKLFFVVKDGVRIAGSIFVFTKKIIQYHLSATHKNYLKNSPMSLLLDHVRRLGTEQGFEELHLGGGVGAIEDSLFNFKAGFSKERHQFKVWRYIVNSEIYNELASESGFVKESSYFPVYRTK